jgi:hypothetical protein
MEDHARDARGDDEPERPGLFFVPGAAYRLVEAELGSFSVDATLELEGEEFAVARLGASPLPGDSRRCAYLVRGAPRLSDGSS